MRPPSSSISSSSRHARRLRGVLATCAWTLLSLIVLDVALGLIFAMPSDPQRKPDKLAQYFDYGRSIDGKLSRMLGPDNAHAAPIVRAGWIDHDCRTLPPPAPAGHRGLTIYGMSFTNRVADQLERLDPAITIARYAGPEASPNHSYACFQVLHDAGHDPDQIQVLGVLASSLPRMLTLSSASTSFEVPQGFTFPRYDAGGKAGLIATEPLVRSPDDMRNPAKWAAFEAQLAAHDAFYDPFVFGGQWADHSVFLRLLRRAYAQAEYRHRSLQLVNDGKQFKAAMGPPLQALLASFAHQVRARGQRPFVILLQDSGNGTDSLARLIGNLPRQVSATIIRTDEIASPDDPRNFLSDGHFTPEVDRKIAQRLLGEINKDNR